MREIQKLMRNGTKANKKSLTKQKTLVVKLSKIVAILVSMVYEIYSFHFPIAVVQSQ